MKRLFFITIILFLSFYTIYPEPYTLILAQSNPEPADIDESQSSVPIGENLEQSLRRLIDLKASQLQELQTKREEIEKNLEQTNRSSNTLARELKNIDYTISQLNLSIKANKLTLEKLELEIDELKNNITDAHASLENRRETIQKLLVLLQQKDKENLFTLILKNKSLGEAMNEAQSITVLNQTLAQNINELKNLQNALSRKLVEEQQKKKEREIEKINLANRQYIVQDQKIEKKQLLTETKNQEKEYQEELKELVEKQQAIAEEIEKVEFELRSKIDPSLLPRPTPTALGLPIVNTRVSQGYGKTKFARYGYKGKFHNGIDFAVPIGTPVFAAEKGVVEMVDDQDKYKGCYRGAYGKYIVIKHDNNLVTLYAHLSRYIVKKGNRIERGDLIGYVGRTGYATGPHLHLTVYAGPTFYMGVSRTCGSMPLGGDLNPTQYLDVK